LKLSPSRTLNTLAKTVYPSRVISGASIASTSYSYYS
jgi:hypothetical protein